MRFEIEFYKTEKGKEPVKDFLDSLDNKMAAKLAKERRTDWMKRHEKEN